MVPQALLDQYLSMTDPSRAQTVDTEIAKHCAYSLPGVALTLGRQNWHCLRETYETLASDMQVWGRRPNLGAGARGCVQRVSLRVQALPPLAHRAFFWTKPLKSDSHLNCQRTQLTEVLAL